MTGLTNNPDFGPVVACTAGGIAVQHVDDTTLTAAVAYDAGAAAGPNSAPKGVS